MAFRRRNKSYPFFSQEFLIQNHADIVFGLVILILIGLMFEVRFSFFSSTFVSLSSAVQQDRGVFTDVTWRTIKKSAPSKVSCPCRRVRTFWFPAYKHEGQFVSVRWLLAWVSTSCAQHWTCLMRTSREDLEMRPTVLMTKSCFKTRRREEQCDCFPCCALWVLPQKCAFDLPLN